ncbi:tol-pal system protein YbgF [Marinomonas sp. 2405UD68-3]|uniref:tol-pal system protein YbgF n=1 Tax=Marinomonas sp. 2405UD68-3 TaxID=3391835 RepID=UPI0039C9E55F
MIDAFKLRSFAMVLSLTVPSALVYGADNNGLTPAAAADLLYQLESLQVEVSQLRGKVEEQSHELSKMKRSQLDRYIDLDKRLTLLLNKPSPVSITEPIKASTPSNIVVAPPVSNAVIVPAPIQIEKPTAEIQSVYRSAYDLVRRKDYKAADAAFTAFASKYPRNELTGNAYYWLGELKLVLGNKEQALENFAVVSSRFSGHAKEADALYKSGIIYDQLNQKTKARSLLSQVIDRYPDTNTSKLASGYLSNIK